MTVNQLIKQLEKLREVHGKTVPVCANATEMRSSCNEVFDIIHVSEVTVDYVRQVDGDGFQEFRSDGREKMKKCIVLK